jgi:catalase
MEPVRGFPQAATAHDTFWDVISLTPEAMRMVMWAMSDRTHPRLLRMVEGFGVHSFRLVNEKGESTFVKFHGRPQLGLQSMIWDEAVKVAGADPDFLRRDTFESIQAGNFPEWDLAVQLFSQEEADAFPFDHLDWTKLIPLHPGAGLRSFAEPAADGAKCGIRAESLADHDSQARRFYSSQTGYEQAHIASAQVFELSKVETAHVREAMVGHLRNIDDSLTQRVADGLGMA